MSSAPGKWGKLESISALISLNFDLFQTSLTLGRHSSCDVVINDIRLSNRHCIITYTEQPFSVSIEDTSSNGTYVNERKLLR